jgi:hypothetical protein
MIGSTVLLLSAAMPFPTEYPTIIVMIGRPWSWSIAPRAISTVMQIRPTSAIAAFDGLNVMPKSKQLGQWRDLRRWLAFSWFGRCCCWCPVAGLRVVVQFGQFTWLVADTAHDIIRVATHVFLNAVFWAGLVCACNCFHYAIS